MIPRYSRPDMAALWSDESRFGIWQEIELLALEARAARGEVPAADVEICRAKAAFQVERVLEIEKTTQHDVIAFVSNLAENIGPAGRHLHYGLTSSDVVDTAFAVQLKRAGQILLADLDELLQVLAAKAHKYRDTVMVGRTHGIHAEPTTFGLKLAGWYQAFQRRRARLAAAVETVAVGSISGAVGTYAHLPPEDEAYVLERLGLKPEVVATQVVPRDRHAEFFTALAEVASVIELVAIEIRHLQRTEVREAQESFARGQKGSSAMPHKRNPILSENLTGLARVIRSAVIPALENVALWHERDISHSSVERVIAPDATIALDFALARLTRLIDELVIFPERMAQNLNLTGGLIFSQTVMLKLVDTGLTREDAYRLVQRNAMKVWDEGGSLREHLLNDPEVTARLDAAAIAACFDLSPLLKRVDTLFRRAFPQEIVAGGEN